MAALSEASKLALSRLRGYKAPPTLWSSLPLSRRAAVLILLFPDALGELRVVLTMRSSSLSSYSGQAALPGGKAEEDEVAWDCARRESEEEVGLPNDRISGGGQRGKGRMPRGFWVEELCEMPTNLAKTELVVRPCVAFLHNSVVVKSKNGGKDEIVQGGSAEENMLPRLDAREVAAVFSAPFRNFLFSKDLPATMPAGHSSDGQTEEPEGHHSVLPPGKWYQGAWTDWHQQRWRMHNFYIPVNNQTVFKPEHIQNEGQQAADQLEGLSRYKVWGMTARILVDAARYAYGQKPDFEHNSHFGDEEMIARLRKIGRLGDIRRPGDVLTKEDLKKAANL